MVDAQDKTEGKVPLCPVQPKIIQQQSAIAQYLQNKLQLFDVKIKPIKDKYEFLEFLLSDLPLENFRPAHSTISVYFEIPTTHLPTLLNRLTQESCAFHFTIQALSDLTMLKVQISDHLPNIEKTEEHLLIQFPSAFTGNHNFENQSQGLNQFEQMQLILNEIKKMHTKKKVLWQEEDKKHYLNLILQLKTLPIDALNAKDQTFIQHIYKNSNGYLH